MINKELTMDEMKELLFSQNIIGYGCYGIVVEIDENTLFKAYYKDVFDTFVRKDISLLDYETQRNATVEQTMLEMGKIEKTKVETMKDNIEQLQETTSGDLIKGIATYNGQLMGIYMSNYKDYDSLENSYRRFEREDRYMILEQVREKVGDLLNHNIIPLDIREDNILVSKDGKNVKLIDLDGGETRYETEDYIKEHPQMKEAFIEQYINMENRLEGKEMGIQR